MFYYIRKYPISLLIIATVIYLSFFSPPSLDVPLFEGIDKVVHFCMYGGLSVMLWLEFLCNHRNSERVLWHAWIGAVLCPILFSGVIEVLQEYCTEHRGGDWLDLVANVSGIGAATIFSLLLLRRWICK